MQTGTLAARSQQMFPVLDAAELARVRRFGSVRLFAEGDFLAKVGEPGLGLTVILSGKVVVTRRGESGSDEPIVTQQAGAFLGELAQLVGRPALVDARASGPVEALIIKPERLRALLVAEAELGERIMRALILRRMGLLETGAGGPVIVGRPENGDVLRLEEFLRRNAHPHHTLNPEADPEAKVLLERFHIHDDELPIVLCPNGQLLRNPTVSQLARCLGLLEPLDSNRVYDLCVVGAGPAGLSAAVYGASEGLSVLVLDSHAFGGQAGASARIENYLGFPTGISGIALMARAYNQAQKFGVEMAIPETVTSLMSAGNENSSFTLRLSSDESARARALVIASGARYRRLAVENLEAFESACVHYWASPLEAKLCEGQEVALVGGGNSAGQAVVFLASRVRKVWLLLRKSDLGANMARYLVERIRGLPNVEVVTNARVSAVEGAAGMLQTVRWRQGDSPTDVVRPIRHLFLFIGAEPNTAWLSGSGVALDTKGFVLTGRDAGDGLGALETSRKGAFSIGDVRASSAKRVATAVGEGAQVVAAVHAFLGTAAQLAPPADAAQ